MFEASFPRLHFIVQKIRKRRRGGRVLDIGFGDGYMLSQLSGRFRVFGIDISEKVIVHTRALFDKTGVEAELKLGGIENIPFPDETFDIVIATEILEHLDDATLEKGIKEIMRVLKKGGLLIGTVPADEKLEETMCHCPQCGHTFHRWGHQQRFGREKMCDLFEKKGFILRKLQQRSFDGNKPHDNIITKILRRMIRCFFVLSKLLSPLSFWFFIAQKPENKDKTGGLTKLN